LRLGTAPDSWGVWFAEDPNQVPWARYLDEAAQAGYTRTELGPYGYLPPDPAVLKGELARRGLTLTGGTVFAALHKGSEALEEAKGACDVEAATLVPLGAKHLILLPEGYTDLDGNLTASPDLTEREWDDLNRGMSALGKHIKEKHGLELVFHSHAQDAPEHVGELHRLFHRLWVRHFDAVAQSLQHLAGPLHSGLGFWMVRRLRVERAIEQPDP